MREMAKEAVMAEGSVEGLDMDDSWVFKLSMVRYNARWLVARLTNNAYIHTVILWEKDKS